MGLSSGEIHGTVCRIGTGPESFVSKGELSDVDVEEIAGRSGASMVQGD